MRRYTPDGTLLGKPHPLEAWINVCFGGRTRNWLFRAAGTSIYTLFADMQPAQLP